MNLLDVHLIKIFHTILLTLIIATALSYRPLSVNAQNDWFQKAKDLFGGGKKSDKNSTYSVDEIAAGLKEALSVGATNVISQLGKFDGFNADPSIHIPLPENFTTVQNALSKVGMSSMLDDLELRLNRAAETATLKTKELLLQSIKGMTLIDVMEIYKGSNDAATKYFQAKMSAPLAETMQPIVKKTLSEVGALQAYDKVMGKYRSIPFVPNVSADLTTYVIDHGLKGIFHYLAAEEAAIRENPAKRTTDLLKRIFKTD